MAENRTLAQKSEMMRFFKLYGLNLRSDVASYLCQLLEPLPQEEHTQWVEAVIEALQKLPITSDQITKEAIYRAAEDAGNVQNVNPDSALEVIDVFKIPRLTYDVDKRKFIIEPAGALDLHGKAADKATLFRNRYNIIHQRTIQHELFKQPVYADADLAARTYSLKKVEFLLGASCRQKKVLVLGLLTSLKEGKYHLEDDTGHIELDLSNASFHSGSRPREQEDCTWKLNFYKADNEKMKDLFREIHKTPTKKKKKRRPDSPTGHLYSKSKSKRAHAASLLALPNQPPKTPQKKKTTKAPHPRASAGDLLASDTLSPNTARTTPPPPPPGSLNLLMQQKRTSRTRTVTSL
ncbi:DNA polymerase epsilon subunit 2-like isoform X3 [Eriocheir sinensis]|uniref:DNA polymerase epsilon subunit 2-like isoform X3 n=1 Tax=Eriocheir sinensis TaxID=95602 RepID=UPI0021C6FAEA|nr:DNA polymerase epsilon subunit 2-like isoform X3 [Eriocheir sinensis]XP_050694812.1 DNA polymerase epsilon subunit 2-like isoform X3 [Eriocheir sinensis]XP_050694813.1 DNA polymerase epsilon subunit 2-like isoform X3 [Eriocheir sinensis]XP_050694815.1 DNA polymerase epsilon subunit 2-like isoform X3 [Eriocheir sinensis]